MQQLIKAGKDGLTGLEAGRLASRQESIAKRQARSQFAGASAEYDANQGHAIVRTTLGGRYLAQSITTGALRKTGLSVPRVGGMGKVDAKPVQNV